MICTPFFDSIGTVLGFVISYRTTSSFERYNEGRKYWSQIILSSRTLARAIWFHVPGGLLFFTIYSFAQGSHDMVRGPTAD